MSASSGTKRRNASTDTENVWDPGSGSHGLSGRANLVGWFVPAMEKGDGSLPLPSPFHARQTDGPGDVSWEMP